MGEADAAIWCLWNVTCSREQQGAVVMITVKRWSWQLVVSHNRLHISMGIWLVPSQLLLCTLLFLLHYCSS